MAKDRITRRLLTQTAAQLKEAVDFWKVDVNAPIVDGKRALSEALVTVIERCITATADEAKTAEGAEIRPVDETARELALLWDDIAFAYRKYKQLAVGAISIEEIDVSGTADLWRAIDALFHVIANPQRLEAPPPVPTLRAHGVADDQIARMYGWYTVEGDPMAVDLAKVDEEAAKPGTHYNADTWVHPALRQRVAAVSAAWATREPRSAEYAPDSFGKTEPPSLEDLVRLRAPAAQIARLHGIEEYEAQQLLDAVPGTSSAPSGDASALAAVNTAATRPPT